MNNFQKTIINQHGTVGKAWLANLSNTVTKLADQWNLYDLKPMQNLSYNYVLAGKQGTQEIILKISLDLDGIKQEASMLRAYAGLGTIALLAESRGAILLTKAIPGMPLSDYFPTQEQEAIIIACTIITRLHQDEIPTAIKLPTLQDWLKTLDQESNIPNSYRQKALEFAKHLIATSPSPVLLHGDLHHDNILQHGTKWVAIDPKGVVGDPAYEVGAFIRNPIQALLSEQDVTEIIQNRINLFASTLSLDPTRITQWCFVQAVLAWTWALEDGINQSIFEQITDIFAKFV